MTPEERLAVAQRVLERSNADATEVSVTFEAQALTRFTREAVTQNVDNRNTVARVRAIVDGRIGIAATNVLDPASLDAIAQRATDIARYAPRETIPPVLASPADIATPAGAFVAATADATANDRARVAGAIFQHAAANGLWSSGYATTAVDGVTLVNSAGARVAFDLTDAGANVKMNGVDSTGFAERYSRDVAAIDGDSLGRIAADIAMRSTRPIAVDPGEWTVILEPAAVGELLRYVTLHFSAEAFSDGSSFVTGKLGAAVLGENVTIRDDVGDPLHPCPPFDAEGVPTQRLNLIEHGIAREIVTDSTWAARLARRNTGHASPAPSANGPQSNATVVAAGTRSLDELIADTKRGLLVTRLWYVRVVDQRSVLLTGMTRDGTFLIENGRVRGGVHNMRFNQSMIGALSDCEIGDTPVRTGSYHYSLVTPAIKFNRFRFASASPY